MPRALVLLIASLCATFAGWAAVRQGGAVAPDAGAPVVVGSIRVAAAELEAAATRAAGSRPGRLASARRAAADRAIERLWLEGEAAERGLVPAAGLGDLRGQVADALAGQGPLPGAARLGAAFASFHERWRSRTRCLPGYRDPYEDRCGDGAGAAAGTCRWMGEATLCTVRGGARRRWLVVRAAPSPGAARAAAARLRRPLASLLRRSRSRVIRLRSRASATATAHALYAVARAARMRAAASARAAAKRSAAARARAAAATRSAQRREERLRDPRLSAAALAAARAACARQLRDSDPYMFGFGMQDVVGQAEGLIAARAAFARRVLASAPDPIDRGKLRPLIDAVGAGNRALVRLAEADAAGDSAAAADRIARLDEHTEPERLVGERLGLGDCLARPAR